LQFTETQDFLNRKKKITPDISSMLNP